MLRENEGGISWDQAAICAAEKSWRVETKPVSKPEAKPDSKHEGKPEAKPEGEKNGQKQEKPGKGSEKKGEEGQTS
jgi:hypothetical protein